MKLSIGTVATVTVTVLAMFMGTTLASAATPPAKIAAQAFAKSPRTSAKPKTKASSSRSTSLRSGLAGFKGTVYMNGQRVSNINVQIQRWNGSSWTVYRTVRANSAGSFSTSGIPANGSYYRAASATTTGSCAYFTVPYYTGASNFFQVKGGYTYTGSHNLYFYAYLARGCGYFL